MRSRRRLTNVPSGPSALPPSSACQSTLWARRRSVVGGKMTTAARSCDYGDELTAPDAEGTTGGGNRPIAGQVHSGHAPSQACSRSRSPPDAPRRRLLRGVSLCEPPRLEQALSRPAWVRSTNGWRRGIRTIECRNSAATLSQRSLASHPRAGPRGEELRACAGLRARLRLPLQARVGAPLPLLRVPLLVEERDAVAVKLRRRRINDLLPLCPPAGRLFRFRNSQNRLPLRRRPDGGPEHVSSDRSPRRGARAELVHGTRSD